MRAVAVERSPAQQAIAVGVTLAAVFSMYVVGAWIDHSPPLAVMALYVATAAWFGGVYYGWLAFLSVAVMAVFYRSMWIPTTRLEALFVYAVVGQSLLYGAVYAFRARMGESLAQSALREQQDLMRVLIDRLPVLVAYLDENRRYVIHNRTYEEWFPGKQIDGVAVENLLGESAYAQIEPMLARVYAGDPVHCLNTIRRNGQERHLDVHYRPHLDGNGNVRGVVALIQDITEHTNALEIIRASEARLRSLAMASASIVWLADRDGLLTDAQGWPQFTGQTPEEYVGTGWLAAVHPEDRDGVYDVWQQARSEQQPTITEYRLRTVSGSYRMVKVAAIPILGEDSNLIEWIGTVRDIDDQFRIEKTLLERERERDTLLENVPHMVWIADPEGTVLFNNVRWYEYTGLHPGDHWKEVTHQDDVERAMGLWEHALKTGEPLVVEKRFRRASDGEYRWHLVQGVPIRDAAGAITRWYGSSTDMEDQKRAIVTLAEANQRISRFLSVLSHELRNPISGIVTTCELLARGDLSNDAREKSLGTMCRQSTHLQRMINDLLDISRVTQGIIELRRESCQMDRLLSDVIADMETEARYQQRVELRFVHADEKLIVDGDPVRLRQIIMNLLVNAIKASDPGRSVEVTLRRAEHDCEVLVADQGMGLSPDVKNTLFEPFVQAETWRRKGLGLGLTIARQLAELHGGSIRALDSEPESGACFVLSLPLGGALSESIPTIPKERDLRSITILIVDDEKENAQALQMLLELEGHQVDVATDAEIAMSRWQERNHTAVLCDLELPGPLDGFDVARALRMQVPRPYLIAYSGYGQPQDLINTREAGFDAHLVKPATLQQILAAIDNAL